MQSQNELLAPQTQHPRSPSVPAAPSAPLPIDPALLRHISGGETTDLPGKGW